MSEILSSKTIAGSPRSMPGALAGTTPTTFTARLPFAQPMPAAETLLSVRAAYEMTVSAACYLSIMGEGDSPAILEAVQILHDISLDIQEDGLDLGSDRPAMEDRIWDAKQSRWERQKAIIAAIHYVTHPGDAHPLVPTTRSRKWRLWCANQLRSLAGMQQTRQGS